MSVEMKLDIPDREPGEEPATEKQKNYIRRMGQIAESDLQSLGKWQASSLIDQMQHIKKSGIIENIEQKRKNKKGCLMMLILIILIYTVIKILT